MIGAVNFELFSNLFCQFCDNVNCKYLNVNVANILVHTVDKYVGFVVRLYRYIFVYICILP